MKKKDFKTELAKLKEMNGSDRIWYIWEYYKIPILACILLLFVLYEIGACIYRNMQDTMLYCVMINEPYVSSSDLAVIREEFEERNGIDKTWRMDTEFDISMTIDGSGETTSDFFYSSASTIKFESLVATNTIDVLITVPDLHAYYAGQDLFVSLKDTLPKELYTRLEEDGRLIVQKDFNGTMVPVGISLDNSYLSDRLHLENGSSLSICTAENHLDMVFDFIEYSLGY